MLKGYLLHNRPLSFIYSICLLKNLNNICDDYLRNSSSIGRDMIKKIIISTLIITLLLFVLLYQYQKERELKAAILDLQTQVSDLVSDKDDLESRINDLESSRRYR
jgi:hypothetical protein